MKKRLIALAAIAIVLLASGFIYKHLTKDPLVGKWGKRTLELEFHPDGKMTIKLFGVESSGNWQRIDDYRINLLREAGESLDARQFVVEIEDDLLYMVAPNPLGGTEELILLRNYEGPSIDPSEHPKIGRAQADISILKMQLESYEDLTGELPTTEQGLLSLVRKPEIEPIPESWIQFYRQDPIDPWSRPYRYKITPDNNGRSKYRFDVWSVGIDGKDGTDDDIGNWR